MDNNKLFFEFLRKNNLLEEYQRILEVLNEPSNSVARYSDQDIYLLNNTKFERGSTGKHGFATLYMENGKRYINLNLQIRFI